MFGTTGTNNICIGNNSSLLGVEDSNEIVIGNDLVGKGSNTTLIKGPLYVDDINLS